ncbi:MAG: GntR family transcriptional regulator [Eubacteriales bacterium]
MLKFQINNSIIEKNQSIGVTLFEKLQRDILLGKLKTGNKLTEQEICDKYNVSRTPVRDAIKKLADDGLVNLIPNRGAFVRGFSEQDFFDMQILRSIYEIKAVEWAVMRITDDELADLEETFEFMEFYTQKGDIEKMLNINMTFHQLIYEASHNYMLSKVLSSYQVYAKYYNANKEYAPGHLDTLLAEHRKIFTAFLERNVEAAKIAMQEHMQNSIMRENLTKPIGGKNGEN